MTNFVSRFGILAEKVGMSRLFMNDRAVAITLLRVPGCHVLKKEEREDCVVLTLGISDIKGKVKDPQAKEHERLGVPPSKLVSEFKVAKDEAIYEVASTIKMEWLKEGAIVDVSSKSVGKGFAGPMKRWNFHGLRASHGVSVSHRSHGSTGTREKIYKGRKMAGRMGQELVTVQNQKVVYIDNEQGLLGICGTIPGKKGTLVRVCKAIKGFGV